MERTSHSKMARDGIRAWSAPDTYMRSSGLAPDLLDLAWVRASQLNGCAWCLDTHTK